MMGKAAVKILLVEDNPSDALLLQEALNQTDAGSFEFTLVERLDEALDCLGREKFAVLLLDLSLPDSTGASTFLRARTAAPEMAIVVLTGADNELVGLEAVRHGVQDYLVKGQSDGRQMARAIRYAIERQQAEMALQRERDQLETRVQERTAELSTANRELQAEIARRERAEEDRLRLLARLGQAQETERGRISRELHDQLGQELTALKLGLRMVKKAGPFAAPVQQCLSQLENLADSVMRDIHRLAWELRPAALDDFGLELALQRYVNEWSEYSGVAASFHSQGFGAQGTAGPTRRLAPPIETTLYRVAQEALTNVLQHARARCVSVVLSRVSSVECGGARGGSEGARGEGRGDYVSLIVEDDGQGFDPDGALQIENGKLGLLGMRERVILWGGKLEIESTPGRGTTVFVRIPATQELAEG